MNEEKESLILTSDKEFKMMNENHLFEAMGLTLTNEEELQDLFSEDINNYLKRQVFLAEMNSVSSPELASPEMRKVK